MIYNQLRLEYQKVRQQNANGFVMIAFLKRLLDLSIRYLTTLYVLRGCQQVGKMTTVRGWPHVRGKGQIRIGKNVKIWSQLGTTDIHAWSGARIEIGDGSFINTGTILSARQLISIGRNCQIANQVIMMDNDFHGTANRDEEPTPEPIILEDNVWIATRCTILKGVRIGEGAVVAAGSVVTKDVAPYTMVGGVPARYIKSLKPVYEVAN